MKIFIASDHRGYKLKQQLTQHFPDFIDTGAFTYDPDDDDVDFGSAVATQMSSEDRAVLLCGSGHGMDMTVNKFPHVRGILGYNKEVVQMGREHEDANVLILPADWITLGESIDRINAFLSTPFSEQEKYVRRLRKLNSLITPP